MKPNYQKLVTNCQYKEALFLYAKAHAFSLKANTFTFPPLLKACSQLQSVTETLQIHCHLLKAGFQLRKHTATALIDAYMKLLLFDYALKVFESIPQPTLPSYTALISGFSRTGYLQESISSFERLKIAGLCANSVSVASVLPACGTIKQGWQLHGFAIKMGYDSDVYVATSLLTMYSNFDEISLAKKVFDLMHVKNVISYNAMISGFSQVGSFLMALDVSRELMGSPVQQPNVSSLLSLLSLCSELSVMKLGMQIHSYYLKHWVSGDIMIDTALIEMYCKCGFLDLAFRVFELMGSRNLVTWSTMISGLLSHRKLDSAMKLFHQLRSEGFRPDAVTWNLIISGFSQLGKEAEAIKCFRKMQTVGEERPNLNILTSILHACTQLSNLRHGKEVHCHVIRTMPLHDDEYFHTALVHLYMSCGCLLIARRVFDHVLTKPVDPAMWNAMISGYGRNGEFNMALEIFRMMQEQRVKPSSATFLSVLSACAHTGQVDIGWQIFKMIEEYGIKPTTEHFGCMIDLLGRKGKLAEAWELMHDIPKPSASVYSSLLGACTSYCNAELGEAVAERLLELEPENPSPLVMLSNVYAGLGRWNEVERLRILMVDKGLHKYPGFSWIGASEISQHI